MLPPHVHHALVNLSRAMPSGPDPLAALDGFFRGREPLDALPEPMREEAELVAAELPVALASPEGARALAEPLVGDAAARVFLLASAGRADLTLAPLYREALARDLPRELWLPPLRARVVEGPLVDALACAPLLGDGTELSAAEHGEARARLEILFWEAGARALEQPDLAAWLAASPSTFDVLVRDPARGTLRGRVVAARTLEVSVRGLSALGDQALVGRVLQVLQPLLLHPEPLVWVHAARALGRLAGSIEHLEGTILDWALGESTLLRQRAVTAFASLPRERLAFLGSQLEALLASEGEEAWLLAAVAAATPYLFHERRDVWERLASRILSGDGGAIASRALARGLAVLFRRGDDRGAVLGPLRVLRERARVARPETLDDARRWIEVIAVTDIIDGAERDPLDVELGLENLVRLAAQYDDEEADARAARFASSLAQTFTEAQRIALGGGRLRQRGAAINAVEGAARALALRLWAPLLATRPAGDPVEEPDLEAVWRAVSEAPSSILDLVAERRSQGASVDETDVPLEVLALRLGGYALDACEEDGALGPGPGPTAHETCRWLRKLDGLTSGDRPLPAPVQSALSSLFWRLVDTTRGSALGEVDDVTWLGPFAAWWALVVDRPAVLTQLATALPMMDRAALDACCAHAEALRTALSPGAQGGAWGATALASLASLRAQETELSAALSALSRALEGFSSAAAHRPDLDAHCLSLVLAGDRLHAALADPVKALHPPPVDGDDSSLQRRATENAPRIAALVARAVRARDLSMLDVWLAAQGPVTSTLLEEAVGGAIRRSPPPPPLPKRDKPKLIEGYELVRPLGEGGIGRVWLVRKPGADRYFVLKIPKADALANANDLEREGILASFVEEAKALAGLYHPHVANIIDRGVSDGVPFLVLEYLIGADLKQYAAARLMSLFELRQVVLEACAGLAALHHARLVHRDIKPANLWLRLPLRGGETFDAEKHRDPAHAPPLSTVVIDFGMVRAVRVPPEVGGRFVAGTAGFIAPEQVLDPVELDPRSDVYALAGTIYNVTTGRTFFDDVDNPRDRIIAHMKQSPFEDRTRLAGFPAAVAALLRDATAMDARDRPSPLELGRAFADAL